MASRSSPGRSSTACSSTAPRASRNTRGAPAVVRASAPSSGSALGPDGERSFDWVDPRPPRWVVFPVGKQPGALPLGVGGLTGKRLERVLLLSGKQRRKVGAARAVFDRF